MGMLFVDVIQPLLDFLKRINMPSFSLNATHLRNSLIKRYALALILIAALATLAFVVLMSALKESDNTAHLVNLSGKQRMLTQSIALDGFRIHHLKVKIEQSQNKLLTQEQANLIKELSDMVEEMTSANRQLSQGQLLGHEKLDLSFALNDLYFGPKKLAQDVENYVRLANDLVAAQSVEESENTLNALIGLSGSLLLKLNQAVRVYQSEGEEKLHLVQMLEIVVWVLTLIILLLEVIFIFQPLVHRLVDLAKENERHLQKITSHSLILEQTNAKLENLAYHDPLTGLYNRLNLEHDIEATINQYQKDAVPFAVFMLDIDWFKKVNDNYGHDAGDFVLISFADLLVASVRETDLVYRAGGEEFVILFADISLEDSQKKAEEIRLKVEDHVFKYKINQIKKTVSIGLYHSDLMPPLGVKTVLKEIDEAMYRSKALGRNRVSLSERTQQILLPRQETCKVVFKFDQSIFETFKQANDVQNNQDLRCLIPTDIQGSIEDLVGFNAQDFLSGKNCLMTFIHPDDLDIFQHFIETGIAHLTTRYPQSERTFLWGGTLRVILLTKQIKITSFEVYYAPAKHPTEARLELVLCESHNMQAAFSDALMVYNFHAMLENTHDFIYFKDQYHVFTAASKSMISVTSVMERSELVGKTDYELIPRHYADQYYQLEKQIFSGEVPVAQAFQPFLDQHGEDGWIDHQKYPIKDQDGKITGLYGIARVISAAEYQRLQRKS